MKATDILGSPPFVLLGVLIARLLPRRVSDRIARAVAHVISRRRWRVFRTLRANLRQVLPDASEAELDAAAERVFYHIGHGYVESFRATTASLRSGRVQVHVAPEEWTRLMTMIQDERGSVIVGPHLGNFDLGGQYLGANGVEMCALGLARPNAGTRLLNRLRQNRGFAVSPIDIQSLRLAVTRLRAGGVVITGVDRPVSEADEPLIFFGRPAYLPLGHIRLAIQTNSRVLVVACVLDDRGEYRLIISPEIEMERVGSRSEDLRHNAQRVLVMVEELIRRAPDQWAMLVPVWDTDE